MKTNVLCVVLLAVLTCFSLLPGAQAVSPPPDGGYLGANTAEGGSGALFSLTTGTNNTALGSQTLNSVTTGSQNTATGAQALKNNTASQNTADGFQALTKNTHGENNMATGWRALFENTAGISNTASGSEALYNNTSGNENTANGFGALFENATGFNNTATGSAALGSNITGIQNTAVGAQAMLLTNGDNNTAIGFGALGNSSGNSNIALGSGAGSFLTTGDNNIDIGFNVFGVAGGANTIRIGDGQAATFIAGISGTAVVGDTVVVDGNGQLGTVASATRFKKDIGPMDKASEAILGLKPVRFRYKSDCKEIPQFGLIAEEVAKVNPALVVPDNEGKPYSVRYEAVNAMLLNEFLKEHKTVQEQVARLTKQEALIAQQQKEIDALTAGLQKVSAQLELNKLAPQTVKNNQ